MEEPLKIEILDSTVEIVATETAHQVVPTIVEGFDRLPLIHKKIMFFEGLDLIFAKKRVISQYNYPTDEGFEDFKEVMHDLGIETSEPFEMGKKMKGSFIYDRDQLVEFINGNKELPPLDEGEDVGKYMDRAEKNGYDINRLNGQLLGYPTSAIEFFVEHNKLSKTEKDKLRDEGKTTIIMTQEEAYICPVPIPSDVTERELFKNAFFETITDDPRIQEILTSGKLEESHKATLKHMPFLQKN